MSNGHLRLMPCAALAACVALIPAFARGLGPETAPGAQPAAAPAVPTTPSPATPTAPPTPTTTPPAGGSVEGGAAGTSSPKTATRLEDLPPSLRLGARAGMVSLLIPAAPTVVIVSDPGSYARAIGSWSIRGRFPVLYDDGSFESAQRIARFVRAFEPESVVRTEKNADSLPWPADAMARRDAIEQAAASAWRDGEAPVTHEGLKDQWKKLRFEPCGVVIAEPDDPTWTGALALAAGHGEPILWASYPKAARGDVSGTMSANDAADLNGAIESSLRQLGYEFQALGDQIDAVTLCYNGPVKIFPGGDDRSLAISLTDFIGRSWNEQKHLDNKRWAWCGQLVGNEAQSAYMAMCSLFLSTKSAWLFDGYEAGEPWSQFDMTLAASALEKGGIRTTVDDIGRQGLPDWRRRAAGLRPPAPAPPTAAPEPGKGPPPTLRGVDAPLIAVNSSGSTEYFDLKPGQGKPGDIPFLRKPAAVYFVHSWSAGNLGSADTVGGRWLARGAYAYLGSVHEPYLQGFVPTPAVMQRLASGVPWGAAVRFEESSVWKIVTIGDPLMRTRGEPKRLDKPAQVHGAVSLNDDLAGQLRAKDFAGAFRTLTLMARDQDLVRLTMAIMDDPAQNFTPGLASAALPAAFFAGDSAAFRRIATVALPALRGADAAKVDAAHAALLDMPWHVYSPVISTLTRPEAELLGQCIRAQTKERDTDEAARALRAAMDRDR